MSEDSEIQASPSIASVYTENATKASDKNLDIAAEFISRFEGTSYTTQEEKALRWRLDKRLIPLLFFNITLGAVDKSTISMGALYNLRADVDMLDGDRYSWAGSAFYLGYLVWCFPAGSLLQRFPLAKTMMAFQIMWGIVLIGTGFTKSFPAFVAMRVLLGVLEAPIAPGNFLVMGMWYTRKEQPLRSGLFYTGMSSFITGPLGYVVGFITNEWFSPWRALFWIVGSITIAYAIILGILLPDNPVQCKFTTEKEKFIAIDRLRADQVGVENKQWKWEQFWEAMLDIKTWILFILNVLINIPNGGLGNFTPLIIAGLGYSSRIASLLFMVVGITSTASCYMCNGAVFLANHYDPKLQVRGAAMIFGLAVAMISTIFLYTLPTTAIQNRLVALFMAYFYLGPYVVSIGLASANTAGYTKKVTVNSMIFMGWCASNIVGPFCFKTNQAPLYPFGIAAMLFSNAGSIIMTCLYMLCCWSDNRQRNKLAAIEGTVPVAETEFRDLTDRQNPNFRYVW